MLILISLIKVYKWVNYTGFFDISKVDKLTEWATQTLTDKYEITQQGSILLASKDDADKCELWNI